MTMMTAVRSSSLSMSGEGCPHFDEQRDALLEAFRVLCAVYVSPCTREALAKKAETCRCFSCKGSRASVRLHACLHCVFVGCFVEKHVHEHSRTSGHLLACDISHGILYCFACKDYLYDLSLDIVARQARRRLARLLGLRELLTCGAWDPDSDGLELLRRHPKRIKIASNSPVGLRGLFNLGNTCFMNCIVQCLTHTPLLRDYFLADRHKCSLPHSQTCLVCEMGDVFQEFYSGKSTPHVPYRLLHLVWTHARHLAGYEQQDAHEFFMAILDVLHRHASRSHLQHQTEESPGSHAGDCRCIIDQIFTGSTQSDIVCQECRGVSTTVEPFWDIALDLGPSHAAEHGSEPKSLTDCLDSFTRPEHMGDSVECSSCHSYQESTKQLTMKKLPIVVSFHLKRFRREQSTKKVSTRIKFPQYLDMAPYMAGRNGKPEPAAHTGQQQQQQQQQQNQQPNSAGSLLNKYCLFAVVIHKGTIETGHYTAYIRQHRDAWFSCDDHDIKKVSLQEVLDSEGYLLFYHKQILEYNN
ncbi:ubiquitin carboxyl-terminal hydrolase 22-like isoform X1 [Varroa jacobsoni]|uniref:Ubiquitin carboxyl-terminal hydrolase n=1 Tax=Varroa destructor TaxID=109461 RepID=A0A7M7KYB8_VARDE|nr:ubiquitin carboxyl-terminal hydrolase 22-like isoform X2 [Varroa destructor]XP_022695708.1 ubiquitin carboxyl-terminal hydrolase 22-like isoform X1 [Varroa jacobsoni]